MCLFCGKVWCHLLAFSEKMLEFGEMQSSVIGSAAVGSVARMWRRCHKLLFVEGVVDFTRPRGSLLSQ